MSVLRRLLIFGWVLFAIAPPGIADEFRPAYLQLRQVDVTSYDVLWKVPALDETTTLKVVPIFPKGARALTPVRSSYAAGTAVQRWRIELAGGLATTAEFNLATWIDVVGGGSAPTARQLGRCFPRRRDGKPSIRGRADVHGAASSSPDLTTAICGRW
jgi:hypothetical protein